MGQINKPQKAEAPQPIVMLYFIENVAVVLG
jgi:hypothetical protein